MPSRLQLFSRFNAFPSGGDLNQNPLAFDAGIFVHFDELPRLGHRRFAVERQPGVDLGRNAAGHDLENLFAEIDEQPVDERS